MFDSPACLRQEQQCLSTAAQTRDPQIKVHFLQMAEIWNGLSKESDATYRFQSVLESIMLDK